ncbi:hypothetical protein V6582_04225 [Agrobacterium vitis]|uniref:hypothetical protein n=1 Tax=Agrobacterium vitis TaxID=373 RepID=UPI0012E78EE8|nr:hypothetical protein [Agrobacterium vitis]MVA25357.1 hypothetical protein [Agrobacterium vitis]
MLRFYFQAFSPQSRTALLLKMLYCRIDCTNPAAKQWLFHKKRRFNQQCGSVSYKKTSVLKRICSSWNSSNALAFVFTHFRLEKPVSTFPESAQWHQIEKWDPDFKKIRCENKNE